MNAVKTFIGCVIIGLFICFFFVACEGDEESSQKRASNTLEKNKHRISTLTYIYDPKVDICYAISSFGYRQITTVPYEKVKEYAYVIEYGGWDEKNWEAYRNAKKGVFK